MGDSVGEPERDGEAERERESDDVGVGGELLWDRERPIDSTG